MTRLESAGQKIVSARLLVMQSKRLLLASAERRLVATDPPARRALVERYRRDAEAAHATYREVVVRWAPIDSRQTLLVVYGNLIDGVTGLAAKLRRCAEQLPPADRMEVAVDIASLEAIIGRWRADMLSAGLETAA